MKLRYSRRALSQLASLHEYLSTHSATGAKRVSGSIRETIARLQDMPLLGKSTDEDGVHVIIEPSYHYRVFYTVHRNQVFVLRILHGRQRKA
jgi:toxin ParE1/3/4